MYTGTNGFYASAYVRTPSLRPLAELFKQAVGYDMPLNEDQDIGLHCTVMHSKHALLVSPAHAVMQNGLVTNAEYAAKIISFDFWDGHNGEGYFVAKLESPGLQLRHKAWKDMGAKPTFETYEPHITLAEGEVAHMLAGKLDQLNRARAAGPATAVSIVLGRETISNQKRKG